MNSMTKSSKTCPFIAVFGLYLMSNSLSSMAHFISLPDRFMQHLLHQVFCWNFNGMSLKVRAELSGRGY